MKRTLWIVLAGALVSTGALAYYRLDARAAAPELITAPITRGPVVTAVVATGTLEPVDAVEVGTQVSGTIASVGADFNGAVR
jgi:HlyD family secretion protein